MDALFVVIIKVHLEGEIQWESILSVVVIWCVASKSIIQIVEVPECVILDKPTKSTNIALESMKTPIRIRATSITIDEISENG